MFVIQSNFAMPTSLQRLLPATPATLFIFCLTRCCDRTQARPKYKKVQEPVVDAPRQVVAGDRLMHVTVSGGPIRRILLGEGRHANDTGKGVLKAVSLAVLCRLWVGGEDDGRLSAAGLRRA